MHSCVTSKNAKWCHLIWPTRYLFTIRVTTAGDTASGHTTTGPTQSWIRNIYSPATRNIVTSLCYHFECQWKK